MFFILICNGCSQNSNLGLSNIEKELKKTPNNEHLLIEAGILSHQLTLQNNDKGYIEKGEEYFKRVLSINSGNCLAKVWYGSLLSIKGKYAMMPWDKIKYVEQGIKLMDEAVKSDYRNISVRLVRAGNNVSLPLFFNRIDTAIVDYNIVISNIEKQKDIQSMFNLSEQYIRLANAYETKGKIDQSIKIWKKVRLNFPGTEQAKIANKKLVALKQ